MVAHVEILRRHHDRHEAELKETKKMLLQQQKNFCRSRTFTDSEGDRRKKDSNQSILRRRISASIIPSQTQVRLFPLNSSTSSPPKSASLPSSQEKKKRDSRKRISSSKKLSPQCLSPSPSLDSSCSMDDRQQDPDGPAEPQLEPSRNPETLPSEQVTPIKTQTKKCGRPWKLHPLTPRSYRCQWVRTCSQLLALLCVVTLMCYLWRLYDGELEL
nr:uncharacterized protein LOC129164758 isoform X1 [Nothobranchius furzeri]XP_054601853.1 uncharacterized protein LOC129164758 isoform X1 [Nothobranchius furzeri]